MSQEHLQVLGAIFMGYSFVVILLVRHIGKAKFSHPFILFNISLLAIGSGLFFTWSLFIVGVLTTAIFAIFSLLAMPTKEAFIASSLAVKELSNKGKPINLWERFIIRRSQ